ncbi:MAG TPA: DDE-type integrase/transposase/recombinase [Xanthobacteraceae bacterium]|nr:DDE-type integrase/transposase/recombinase [Xanthobacteraceae bacterium]
MTQQARGPRVHERWAHLRFSVIGQLLAAPPPKGELRAEIEALAGRQWRHPITGEPVCFGFSTIERWYYRALKERTDPVGKLRRKRRADAGRQPAMSDAVRQAVLAQYAAHKGWSAKLHHDNLVALSEKRPELRPLPSYSTLRRFLKAHGLAKRRRVTSRRTEGAARAEARLFDREVRSYEAEYVGGVWHWDCHVGSKKVLTQRGEWQAPVLFGVLDDRSRLACHLQWYFTENAENIAHGLSQAFQRRGLPRSAQSDNGAAMTAAEIVEGLNRLGILHQTTLPYSPYMNAKIETLWGLVEGRLLAMLEDVPDLTLAFLNEATLAWAEYEYNRKVHSEIGEAPIARFLAGPDVMRPSPDSATLKLAFTKADRRTQRRSDGTIVIEGNRFEVPNRYRHFTLIEIRYASWDLAHIHLVDEHTGQVLCRLFPQDKTQNASGLRRPLDQVSPQPVAVPPASGIAPLLAKLINQQAASGLPPPYLPKDEQGDDT